jgi:hypothetical protein
MAGHDGSDHFDDEAKDSARWTYGSVYYMWSRQ